MKDKTIKDVAILDENKSVFKWLNIVLTLMFLCLYMYVSNYQHLAQAYENNNLDFH